MSRKGLPEEVALIRKSLKTFLDQKTESGQPLRQGLGVYAFFDYDGEPIYVGQTEEGLGARIGRHLTNQRTDAVAMNVLDPFEVAEVAVWPLRFGKVPPQEKAEFQKHLAALEYAVFQQALADSAVGQVLNEKTIPEADPIELPKPYRSRIVPDEIYQLRSHPDIRIARRASTIARLAQVISERDVSNGLRRTLLTQARRLELLARQRFEEFGTVEIETLGEETGE